MRARGYCRYCNNGGATAAAVARAQARARPLGLRYSTNMEKVALKSFARSAGSSLKIKSSGRAGRDGEGEAAFTWTKYSINQPPSIPSINRAYKFATSSMATNDAAEIHTEMNSRTKRRQRAKNLIVQYPQLKHIRSANKIWIIIYSLQLSISVSSCLKCGSFYTATSRAVTPAVRGPPENPGGCGGDPP